MRDLEVNLRDFKVAKYFKERAGLRADTEKIAIKAIERAIKAEAEVERLQKVYSITNESWQKIQAENAQLRKVADAARGLFLGEGEHLCSEFEDAMDRLEQALAELDEEPSRD